MKRKLTTRLRITLQSVLCVFLALLLANPAAAVLSEATLDFYNINGIYTIIRVVSETVLAVIVVIL